MKTYQIIVCIGICFSDPFSMVDAQVTSDNLRTGPQPDWVVPAPLNLEVSNGTQGALQASVRYLLLDRQMNAEQDANYQRTVLYLENVNGVQQQGRQSFDFDPSYEALVLHQLNVIREGKVITHLDRDKIRVLQRETDLQRHLYDETLTALVILEDLRVGDILDYAFTRIGSNPALNGTFVNSSYFQYSAPVNIIQSRLLIHPGRHLQIKEINSPPTFEKNQIEELDEYIWRAEDIPAVLYDDKVPSNYFPYPAVFLTEFQSWKSVVDWGLPLFEQALEDLESLKFKPWFPHHCLDESVESSIRIRQAIEFVQDEIRYFGIETGPNSLVPSPVNQVLERSFGDCKDKSVLLIGLLRLMGLEAHPVLLSTYYGKTVKNWPPSPYSFNHAIVQYKTSDNQTFYVDPTYNYQRGDTSTRSFPDYEAGLVLCKGNDSLTDFPTPAPDNYHAIVHETYTFTNFSDPVEMTVKTEFLGSYADSQRTYYQSSTAEELEKLYFDFYSGKYDDLTVQSPVSVTDYESDNRIQVTENYAIGAPWYVDKESSKRTFSVSAPLISEGLVSPKTENRSMPLSIPYPYKIDKNIRLNLPKSWNLGDSEEIVDSGFFYFKRTTTNSGNRIEVTMSFHSKANEVPTTQTKIYLEKKREVEDLLIFTVEDDISIPDTTALEVSGKSEAGGHKQFNILLLFATTCFVYSGWAWGTSKQDTAFRSNQQQAGDNSLTKILILFPSILALAAMEAIDLKPWLFIPHSKHAYLNAIQEFILWGHLCERFLVLGFLLKLAVGSVSLTINHRFLYAVLKWHALAIVIFTLLRLSISIPEHSARGWHLAELILYPVLALVARSFAREVKPPPLPSTPPANIG